MKKVWMAVAALLALSVIAEEPKGTLCFVTGGKLTNCSSSLHVEPSDTARLFVWTSDDGTRVAAGTLPAKADAIDLAAKAWHAVAVRVTGNAAHGWPLETTFRLSTPERDEWLWSVPAKSIKRFATLLLAPGRYLLTATAEHHNPLSRPVSVTGDARLNVDMPLMPLIVVSGMVVTHEKDRDVPLGGATIHYSSGVPGGSPELKLLSTTGDDGRFRTELPPARFAVMLLIAKGGYATKSIDVAREPGDKDYGPIVLTPGTTLKVHITRPDLEDRKLTVTLLRTDEKYEKTQLATRTLEAREDELTFDDLAPAEHFVVVRGSEPLERTEKSITLKEGKADVLEIEIRPFRLDGHVRFGGEPLTEGKVGLSDRQVWRTDVAIDAAGHFGGSMWQRGKLSAWVSNPAFGTPYFAESPSLGDADPSVWDIDVPKRVISGRVLDEETKQPLAVAPRMSARAIFTGGTFDGNVEVAPDGTYHVLAVHPGDWSLLVNADGYMMANPHITIAEADGPKTLDVLMSRGTSQELELAWPNGAPVAGAYVTEGSLGRGLWRQRRQSDPNGHVAVRGRAGETQTVYVAPVDGSFAVAHVTFGREAGKTIHVTVPPPAGTLRIHGVDASGAPARFSSYLLRWNGELVLPDALALLGVKRPAREELEIPRLPAGVYEIWLVPFGQNVPPTTPPVRVDLAAGDVDVNVRP